MQAALSVILTPHNASRIQTELRMHQESNSKWLGRKVLNGMKIETGTWTEQFTKKTVPFTKIQQLQFHIGLGAVGAIGANVAPPPSYCREHATFPIVSQCQTLFEPRSCKRSNTLFQKSLLSFLTWREYFYSQPTHFSSQPKK